MPQAGGPRTVGHLWSEIREQLREELGEQSFQSWVANLRARELDDRTVAIEAPNRFCRETVDQNYGFRIRQAWSKIDAAGRMIQFGLQDRETQNHTLHVAASRDAAEAETVRKAAPPSRLERTFDNFVTGPANEVAAAVARQAALDPDARFNPVYIHGGYGVGKTHLLRAIQHESRQSGEERRVAYITGERFTASFTSALKTRDTAAFKDEMRNVDLLLLDDVHIMAGKAVTQEEFYHTIADLIQDGRQVVITGDRPPAALDGLDERLRSLLMGGLRCDIQPADLDLRRRILDQAITDLKNSAYPQFDMPGQARDFMAARVTASPRELIGALNTVVSRTIMLNREADVEAVTQALADYAVAAERRVTVDRIQKQVASFYNLALPDMLSQRRARAVARPRQIAMYLSKTMTQRSLPDIGRRFGGRDHTTVLHAVRRIKALMESDPAIGDDVKALTRLLQG